MVSTRCSLCSNVGKLMLLLMVCFAATNGMSPEENKERMDGEQVREASGEAEEEQPLAPFPNEEDINLHSTDIHNFFEADIILTPKQKEVMVIKDPRLEQHVHERAVVRDPTGKWPNAVIYYTFDRSLPSSYVSAINSAMQTFRDRTCVQFQPRNRQSDYVNFIRGRGCYSYVGRIGGRQEVSIGTGCQYEGIIMHEIFHALGRWHEHSRPDRDNYIRVNYNNIRNGLEDQFDRLSSTSATTNGISYDYYSVMHYGAYAFSRNRQPTIVPKVSGVGLNNLGQRNGLSNSDFQHVEQLYCRSRGQWSAWSTWSQCSASCGGGRQTRTRSCVGSGCPGSNSDTRVCNAPQCIGQWSGWGSWSSCSPSCGNSRSRSRRRTCQGGGGCSGSSTQTAVCPNLSCSSGSSEWGAWTPCTRVCGGYQLRRRTCLSSATCPYPRLQFRLCNTGSCSFRRDQGSLQQNQQKQGEPGLLSEPNSANSAGSGLPMISLLSWCVAVLAVMIKC